MTDLAARLDEIEAHARAARDEIAALCGGKPWTMRVPAREDEDSDLVIWRALNDNSALLATLRAVLAVPDDAKPAMAQFDRPVDTEWGDGFIAGYSEALFVARRVIGETLGATP